MYVRLVAAHVSGELLDHGGGEGEVCHDELVGFQAVPQSRHESVLQLAAGGGRTGCVSVPVHCLASRFQLQTQKTLVRMFSSTGCFCKFVVFCKLFL